MRFLTTSLSIRALLCFSSSRCSPLCPQCMQTVLRGPTIQRNPARIRRRQRRQDGGGFGACRRHGIGSRKMRGQAYALRWFDCPRRAKLRVPIRRKRVTRWSWPGAAAGQEGQCRRQECCTLCHTAIVRMGRADSSPRFQWRSLFRRWPGTIRLLLLIQPDAGGNSLGKDLIAG